MTQLSFAMKPMLHKFSSIQKIRRSKWLYIMLIPCIVYYIIFHYLPMWGVLVAFQDYQPYLGLLRSQWVGLKHFANFISDPWFYMLFRNTIIFGILNLVLVFPLPIILSLMMNELRGSAFKRIIQSISYIPHFLSWVIVVSITYVMFTTEGGIINEAIMSLGGNKIDFLMNPSLLRPMVIGQIIWKSAGWGTIIFLAALSNVDIQLYESAVIDGAGRWKQMWHITLPAIRSTIIILMILQLGHFLNTGFDQLFLMNNAMNRQVGEVFDTYVYSTGLLQGRLSYSTAVGLFKSVVGMILIFASDRAAKKIGEEGIL